MRKQVDGQSMFAMLFDMADKPYGDDENRQKMIEQTIQRFVKQNTEVTAE